ncbi:hydrolase glyoxylase [Rubrivivax gelatinosus]|nr:hydrolase glyoxylase [Rubrivivax gelatinosus]
MDRRLCQTLLAAFVFAPAALAACASPAAAAPAPLALADGVYWMPGAGGEAEPANGGRIGNSGFVVGPEGVVAIDTGTSYAQGRSLIAAIRATTDRPLKLALITHVRPEFLFGASAFREAGVPVAMHAQAARLMVSRCDTCLEQLRRTLGDAAMAGSAVLRPQREFSGPQLLAETGRRLELLHYGHSSGPGDVALWDPANRVLFAGGLVENRRVPDIADADLPGWQRALAALAVLAPRSVVPAHGPAGTAEQIAATSAYLKALDDRAHTLVADGASLIDVPDAAALPAYAGWDQYETVHRRNASIAFLRAERALLLGLPTEARP